MNDEILDLVEGLEVIANVLIKDGQTHKRIDLKTLVKLCEYIKKINKQYPVGFASEKELRKLNIKFTTLYPLKTSKHNIPLYRLD